MELMFLKQMKGIIMLVYVNIIILNHNTRFFELLLNACMAAGHSTSVLGALPSSEFVIQ